MGFLGNIERALGVWYPDPENGPDDTNPLVVLAFRDYLIQRLGAEFSCAAREERMPGEPDLIVLRNADERRFDVITCYRSQMFVGQDGEAYLPWTSEERYKEYCAYAESEGYPVYVVIGLHGFADVPKFLFAVPLEAAAIDLKKSVLSSYEVKDGASVFM
ncbi:MAG: hypothetical protein Q4Q04_00980 [Methanocorpusculum sp.]|nr:hypothetical protein [Methanocorpusculum sp.]